MLMRAVEQGDSDDELRCLSRRFRSVIAALGGFSFAINLLLLAPAIYMLQVYDRVLTSRNELTLGMLTLILLFLLFLEATLEFVRSRVLVRASTALDLALGGRIFEASFEDGLRRGNATVARAMSDFTNIRQFLSGNGALAFFDAPWTPVYIAVVFLLHPWLGMFAVAAAAILLAMAYATERYVSPVLSEAAGAAEVATAYASGGQRNAESLEAMGMLDRVRARWAGRQTRFLVLQAAASDTAALINSATRFFRLMLQSLMLGLGALLVIDSQLSAGGMIAASILLSRALAPVELGILTWRGFVSARAAYDRLKRLLENCPTKTKTLDLPRPDGKVSVENLVVGSPGSATAILKGISFSVEPGSLVAIIGPSASGKSTLARAIVGVWGPMNGAVRLDGADVFLWDKSQLGQWVGYVPQDVELLEGTIGENISRFGDLDSGKIIAAARHAGVHELILRLAEGYDTRVGPGGQVLSGGQRQRIALARALYGEPALVVLDEPNSNLDEAGEAALFSALKQLKDKGTTTFVVTHRTSVLNLADRALLLSGGILQAFGSPEQVRNKLVRAAQAASVMPRP